MEPSCSRAGPHLGRQAPGLGAPGHLFLFLLTAGALRLLSKPAVPADWRATGTRFGRQWAVKLTIVIHFFIESGLDQYPQRALQNSPVPVELEQWWSTGRGRKACGQPCQGATAAAPRPQSPQGSQPQRQACQGDLGGAGQGDLGGPCQGDLGGPCQGDVGGAGQGGPAAPARPTWDSTLDPGGVTFCTGVRLSSGPLGPWVPVQCFFWVLAGARSQLSPFKYYKGLTVTKLESSGFVRGFLKFNFELCVSRELENCP